MTTTSPRSAKGGIVDSVCAVSVMNWLADAPTSIDLPVAAPDPPATCPATPLTPLPYSTMRGSSHAAQEVHRP